MNKLRPDVGSHFQDPHALRHNSEDLVDTPIKVVTWRSFVMGLFVSMGGFTFGYDTGQISGFLEMEDFLRRFGELRSDGSYHFSNVRAGLIVGLVRFNSFFFLLQRVNRVEFLAFYWNPDGSTRRSPDCRPYRSQMVHQCMVRHGVRWDHCPDLIASGEMVSSCLGSLGRRAGSRRAVPVRQLTLTSLLSFH